MAIPAFFILGRPRSGTTLLKALFDAHPNVRIPSELPVFLPLYQKFKHIENWDEAAINLFVDHVFQPNVFNLRRIENLKIDRDAFQKDLLALAGKTTIQELLMKINEHAFSLFPKEKLLLVGDKKPVYSVFTRRLLKIFPGARFICIIRDYRDNFLSLRSLEGVNMEAPVLSLQISRWRYITRTFMQCSEKYPDRFHVIRYEDLVSDPEKNMANLCGFLKIPYKSDVFNFHQKKDEFLRVFPDPKVQLIHRGLMDPVNTSRIGRWKTEMSEREVKTADQIAGKFGHLLGYTSTPVNPEVGIFIRSIPMMLYCRLLFKLMIAGSRMPYPVSRWLSLNVTRLARFYSALAGKQARPFQVK